jgi:4a-hydroxytetrahydrobiopterin dehydratase
VDGSLVDRRCGACTASTPPATEAQVRTWLLELPRWAVVDGRLVRELRLRDFAEALAAANRVGAVAEAEGHHPDLAVGWGRLGISVFTHAIGALSEADFVLAAKIDRAVGP